MLSVDCNSGGSLEFLPRVSLRSNPAKGLLEKQNFVLTRLGKRTLKFSITSAILNLCKKVKKNLRNPQKI